MFMLQLYAVAHGTCLECGGVWHPGTQNVEPICWGCKGYYRTLSVPCVVCNVGAWHPCEGTRGPRTSHDFRKEDGKVRGMYGRIVGAMLNGDFSRAHVVRQVASAIAKRLHKEDP